MAVFKATPYQKREGESSNSNNSVFKATKYQINETENVMKSEDFEAKSGYVSTESSNWWKKLWSSYGLGYDDLTYEYINNQNGLRDEIKSKYKTYSRDNIFAESESDFEQKGYDFINEQEISLYNYYYNTEGKDKAQKYLDSLEDALVQRKAGKEFEALEGETLKELFYGVVAGADQFRSGVENVGAFITGDEGQTSSTQYVSGMVRDDLADDGFKILGSSVGQIGYDLINTTTNMLPSILVGAATGGVGGLATMGASVLGNSYSEMRRLGYNEWQSRGYAAAVTAAEVTLQKVLGGISSLGGGSEGIFQTVASKVLPKVDNAIAKAAIQLGGNMLDEGLEEAIQEVLDPIFKAMATGEDFEGIDLEKVLYSGLIGALSAGTLEGRATIQNTVSNIKSDIQAKEAYGDNQSIQDLLTEAVAIGGEAANAADKYLAKYEKKGELSGANINAIMRANDQELRTQDKAKIKAAAEAKLTEYGETGDVSAIADILVKQASGEKLSSKEANALKQSKAGQQVSAELDAKNLKSGLLANDWARDIETDKINSDVYTRDLYNLAEQKVTKQDYTDAERVIEQKFKVSDDGKTTIDGDEVSIKEISSVKDGDITLRLENGETVNANDVEFSSSDEMLYATVVDMNLNAETANAFIRGFNATDGLTAEQYALGFREAYKYGSYSFPVQEMSRDGFSADLSESQKSLAYNLGKVDAKYAIEAKQNAVKNTKVTKEFHDDSMSIEEAEAVEGLTNRQKTSIKAMKSLSKALGLNVRFFESKVNDKGKRVGENGRYDPSTGILYIDIYAGLNGEGTILFTAGHELTHFIRQWSPSKFKVFADALLEEYGKEGVSVDARVREQIEKAKRKGRDISYDTAYEEVIADSCEAMLADGDAFAQISAKIKAKDKSLWKKIKDFFTDLVAKIKAAYTGLKPDSPEGQFVSEMLDTAEQLKALWTEALVEASENYAEAESIVSVDTTTESVSPMFSERTWTESDYVVHRDQMAKKIAKALDITEQKAKSYIDDINSIARMIANDRVRLDYEASSFGSAFVSNVEYGGSFDYTTLCKKRRIYTGTFTEIQKRLKDTALTPDDILTIRNMLIEEGIEATCGLCYVEGSRANMGKFAKEFIRLYKRDNPLAWIPNMADVNTPDGVEQMRISHPEAYEQYVYFWNHYGKLKDSDPALFASQQKPKLYESRKEYKGEILEHFKGDTAVEKKNLFGGIRMQSFSDFEIVHLIDTMQVIMDMSTVGLAGQAYTKVPEFAKAFGNTGLKINLSLIAKGVDADGNLIFDDREGMPHETAFDLRNQYSENVGTIIVTFTDAQLLAAMADPRIDYIIPFHRSQWKKGQYGAMGLPKGTKDYTYMQNEKLIKPTYHEYRGRLVKDKATNYMPNEYWDFSKSGKENAEAYLKMCAENNKRPKFYKLLDYDGKGTYSLKADGSTDGYWKLLIDFKMYDNDGVGSPQRAVTPTFNMDEARTMLDEYKGGHASYPVAHGVVDRFVEQYEGKSEVKYSDRDSDYLDAVNRGDMETAQKMVDEAAEKALSESKIRLPDGKLRTVYHGTNTGDFTVFNPDFIGMSSGDDGFFGMGFYFAYSKGEAQYYGANRIIPAYLDLKNPFDFETELQKYKGEKASAGHAPDAVALMNFADKFEDIAKDITIDVVKDDSDTVKEISLAEFSKAFKEVIENKKFEYTEITNEYGEKETLVTSDPTTYEYEYNGEKHTYKDYAFQKRFWGKPNKLDVAYEYLSSSVYRYVDMIRRTRLILDYNREFTAALKEKGYDGAIQSQLGDAAVAFYPEQIKSADPVTYDDNGNVIPLSERFKSENNDIRYSFRDSESGMANDALSAYDEELTRFIEQRGDYIVDSFDKLKQIVNLAFDNPNLKATAYFGIINTETLEKIKNSIPNLPQASKDILFKKGKEYSIATTLDAIRHIVDDKKLSREDVIDYLDRLADTIMMFDSVAFDYYHKGQNKTPGLLFKKKFEDGTLVSFDLVSHKKRSVVLQTLYMDNADYQKKKSAETLLMQNASSNTSKTQVGQTSDNIISENTEFVNSEFSDTDIRYSDREIQPITETEYETLKKHFGVTANFRVAGYLLPDGKLLDFSGKHWGDTTSRSRQVDHRDVQEVLERGNNGISDMVDMIGSGSIRLMPEIGGINLAVYPNEKQRRVLSLYIKQMLATEGQVIIDYDSVGGDTVHSRVYEKYASSAQILSDIRNYFNGARQSDLMRFRSEFSDRDTDSVSNRTLLANALESVAQNDIEKTKLTQYKEKIALIEAEQKKLSETRAKIKELSFAKGARDTEAIKKLQFDANQMANRINTYDKQLLSLESTKALKGVLEREKATLRKKLEQKNRESLANYREKAAKTQRELLTRYQESRKNAIESRHKTEMRHKIKKVVSDLNKLLLNPTKEQHVPIGLQGVVADALDAINMDTMNAEERVKYYNDLIAQATTPEEKKRLTEKRDFFEYRDMNFKERITALKNAYAEFKESDDPLIRNAHNDAIADLIKNVADSVGNNSLKDMTYAQLEAVYDMYKAVLATVRNANKMFKEGRQETVTENSEAVKVEVKEVGGHQDRVLKSTKFLKKFGWDMLKPVTAMKVIGSKTLAKLFDNVRAAEDTWAVDVNEAKEFYKAVSDKYGYDKWDFKAQHSFKDGSGEEFSISLEQMLSLYAYSKREQADEHLEFGGFIFDDAIEVTEKNKLGIPVKYEVNDANPHRLGQIQIMEITGKLTQEQRAFVDEMQTYLSEVIGAKGNEVSLALYDIKLYKEKNYFPLKTARYFREFDPEKSGTPKIKNSGFSKKTVPQAGNPIVLSNFMDVWASHVNDMSMYHAFVLPLEDFMRVYNYSSTAGGYDSVQQYIKNAYGSQANQYIERLMDDLNGGARVDSSADPINKGISLFKKASVFASASVVIQQPSAIARAFAYINPKYFATSVGSALNLKKHKEVWAEVKQYAPVAVIKEMGYFDTGMGRSTVEWIKGNKTIKDKMDDALSKAPAMADELSWSYIWLAVKNEIADTTDLAPGSEEFLKKVGERFTEIITNTQVYDSVLSRSGMMRSKDTGMKMATAFMAEPTTTVNMMIDGILQGKRGNKKFLASTVGAVSASIILNAILVALVYAARDDDEDETYTEKYVGSLTSELVDGFNPLTYIPFVKDIWSIAQGYDVERSDMSVVSNLWESIEGLFNENKSGWEKVTDATGAVSSLFGIPLKNIIRDAKGMYNLTETLLRGTPTTGTGLSEAIGDAFTSSIPLWDRLNDSDSASARLYKAILKGDASRYRNQYKTEAAYETAVRNALRDNDSRIHEAAQARYEGDIAEYTRIAKSIISEGNFSQDIVVGAINAEMNAIKRGETTAEEPTEDKDEVTSIYSGSDVNSAFDKGDYALGQQIISELIETKVANGMIENNAKSSVRSSMTSYWKPLYKEAYRSGDTNEMARIRQILYSSGLYGSANEVVKTTQGWLKS